MNRVDFQLLAEDRLRDSQQLLDGGRWSGAYYLAGYAVECALKGCVAKLVKAEDFPDKKLAERAWTHELEKLLDAAQLKSIRDLDIVANKLLGSNWGVVQDWSERSRYDKKSETEARSLFNAVSDSNSGVLQWVKTHW